MTTNRYKGETTAKKVAVRIRRKSLTTNATEGGRNEGFHKRIEDLCRKAECVIYGAAKKRSNASGQHPNGVWVRIWEQFKGESAGCCVFCPSAPGLQPGEEVVVFLGIHGECRVYQAVLTEETLRVHPENRCWPRKAKRIIGALAWEEFLETVRQTCAIL